MKKRVAGVVLALIISFATAHAADLAITCPASLAVRQSLTTVPTGWDSGTSSAPIVLSTVSFFEGPPSEQADLVYDRESDSGNKRTATWQFSADNKRGIWLQCGYAATTALVSKRLPNNISECTVTYRTDVTVAGMPEVKTIRCKTRE